MSIKNLLIDIRFWIFFFFLIRLIGITNPPLEVSHNWRQTTVTMVSRNFLETNNNIFYPSIDIAGEKTGITGMEFPLLNYLHYLVSVLFGYQHWYGRLINLIISSFGLWFFYKLLKKYFIEQHAFYATIILIVSIWFQFSRKIMPDTFSMSMILACIYFGSNYLETHLHKKQYLYLISYLILLTLGLLSKLPSGYLLIVFVIFFLNKNISLNRKLIFSTVTLFGLIPVMIWYFYWVPYLVEKFGFLHFIMGKSFSQGFTEIAQNIPETLKRFYDTPLKYIGFAVFLFGLMVSIIKKEWKIYSVFALSLFGFSIIIFKSGYTFPHHNYYIIPFVPVMALVAGYGLTKMQNTTLALIVLIAISVEGIANQTHDFSIKENDLGILNLEMDLDKVSNQHDLILINSGNYPTPMYFSHRKGWVADNHTISNEKYIEELKNKGLKYIVILKRSFSSEIKLNQYKVVLENNDYCIYDVSNTINE